MEHDVVLTCADGSVRIFRIYGRAAPCVGGVFTLPIDGELLKVRADRRSGTKIVGSVDHVNAAEMEMA
jgi:hypothetical protein